ncbi:MAG: hypothetical protein II564_07985 [Oscillospiraceae bacterium]|nr:hypothetical protein [Oscillospiraceae bacterium]
MNQNSKPKITDSKLFWMVVSLFISLVLWTYVTQQDNSTITRTFSNVKVEFTGEDELENAGLAIANVDTDEVSVTLRGSRRVMGRLDSSKIAAVIDVGSITRTGEMKWAYYLKYTGIGTDNNNISVVSRNPETISFSISELKSKTVDVKAEFTGTTAYGYYAKDPVVEPTSINISGSSYVLQNIAGVKAYIYGTDESSDLKETISVDSDQFVVLDVNGDEIDKSSLMFSVDHVDVSVPIGTTKMVPLTLNIEDTAGLTKDDCTVSIDPSQVEVTGDPEVLNALDSISLGSFSLEGLGESYEQNYDITYPDGVTSVDNVTQAKVKIKVQGMEAREFTVTDVTCDNVPDNMIAEPVGNLTILLRGSPDDLESVSEANLHAVADLANASHEQGSVTVPVTITCDIEDIGIVGSYQMAVSLKNK